MHKKSAIWHVLPFVLLSVVIHAVVLVLLASGLPIVEVERGNLELVGISRKWIVDVPPVNKVKRRPEEPDILGGYNQIVQEKQVAHYGYEQAGSAGEREASIFSNGLADLKEVLPGARKLPIVGDEIILPEEFYRDYRIGDKTYLNVARFKEMGYFRKLAKVLGMTFNPVPALRYYLRIGQLRRGYIITLVGVSIRRDGTLSELFVIKSSGFSLYDSEALRIFRASSPFFAPPPTLLSEKGTLNMAVAVPVAVF